MDPIVQLDSVTKQYGALPVIANFSAIIAPGEIISLVGPSGCGKSTLLRLIAGTEAPNSGRVYRNVAPEQIGFVFQDVRLLPWRTALQNVTFVLRDRIPNPEERDERARQALHSVGLGDFTEYKPHQLSGGMQKRVAIARALAIESELLLFDEPFSDLDLPLRLLLIQEIQRILHDGEKTAVYVTHDIREALTMSDRVYVLSMRPTEILETINLNEYKPCGEPDQLSSEEMNRIEARIIDRLQAEIIRQ